MSENDCMQIATEISIPQIINTRLLDASREEVFNAWINPVLLAQWWGPKGFTNTFEIFEPRPGGQWKFVMHGPNGANHPNESEFVEMNKPERIVINHISAPLFKLTATFEEVSNKTKLTWCMDFPSNEEYERVRPYAPKANEQNLDRLEAVIQKQKQAKPINMTQLSPYVNFNGTCREAMTFYKDTLGGELSLMAVKETPMASQCPAAMQDQIMHASLMGEGFSILASDMLSGETYQPGNNFSLTLNCSSEEQIRSLFNKLEEGGKVYEPLQEQFWGAIFGMVVDKFGTRWILNYDKPKQA